MTINNDTSSIILFNFFGLHVEIRCCPWAHMKEASLKLTSVLIIDLRPRPLSSTYPIAEPIEPEITSINECTDCRGAFQTTNCLRITIPVTKRTSPPSHADNGAIKVPWILINDVRYPTRNTRISFLVLSLVSSTRPGRDQT